MKKPILVLVSALLLLTLSVKSIYASPLTKINHLNADSAFTFNPIPSTAYGSADFDPGATAPFAITYTSANTAVATIVDGKIHIVGAGVSNIKASTRAGALTQKLTVTKVALTVSVNPQTKVYGAMMPDITLSYSGFVNGDDESSLMGVPLISTTATSASPVGSYTVSVGGAAFAQQQNYTVKFVGSKLTITKAKLTITPVDQSFPYGQPVPALTAKNVNYYPLVNGDAPEVAVTTPPTVTTTAPSITPPAGHYQIIASGAASTNYTLAYAKGNLDITQLPLSVTVANTTKTQGTPNPLFSVMYTGNFRAGESPANFTKQPKITTTATTDSPEGTYSLNVSGAVDPNYAFKYIPGTFTITAAATPPMAANLVYPVTTVVEGQKFSVVPKNTGGEVTGLKYVSLLAGSGTAGHANGTGAAATFKMPGGSVAALNGIVYVADQGNNLIRKITPLGVVTTYAGSGTAGFVNGPGTTASFNNPVGIMVARSGNVYVADQGNNVIRKIFTDGTVATFAGSGVAGFNNGSGAAASFNKPTGIAISPAGNIYVMDTGNGAVREIFPTGLVITVAQDPALFNDQWLTVASDGTVFVTGTDNYVRRISTDGQVSIYAGNGTKGFANGSRLNAMFNSPSGISIDNNSSTIYVADAGNNMIRAIQLVSNSVITYAGNGAPGSYNSRPITSTFTSPKSIICDLGQVDPDLYLTDASGTAVRKIAQSIYNISPPLPQNVFFDPYSGSINGMSTGVAGPRTYMVSAYNSGGTSLSPFTFAVSNSVDPTTVPNIYTIAGNGSLSYGGDGGPAAAASLYQPYASAIDKTGNIYVASYGDNRVRKIDAVTKVITTIAGNGTAGFSGDGGDATNAQLSIGLTALALDASGNIYIGDYNNNRIRKVDAATNIITTFAGTGNTNYQGDGVLAGQANLSGCEAMAFDASGNMYIVDAFNTMIRKIDANTHAVTTIGGGGGNIGESGILATSEMFGFIERLEIYGNTLYVPDETYNMVYSINLKNNKITLIAGSGASGNAGDGGPATDASFGAAIDAVADASGNVYIADQISNVIRKVDAVTKNISTYAGLGIGGYSGDGGSAALAQLNFLSDIKFDKKGNLYVTDLSNARIRRIGGTPSTQTITFDPIPAKVYGSEDFKPTVSASSGLDITGVSSNPAVAIIDTVKGMLHIVGVGVTTLTASQAGNGSFLPAKNVSRNLVVTKAPLTIKASDTTKVAGKQNPKFTITYTGLVTGDILGTAPVATTTAVKNSPAGTYPITVSGAADPRYNIKYVAGVLTITAAGTVITGDGISSQDPATAALVVKPALSPNGDGVNDALTIDNIGKYPDNKVTIMNSSGAKVFEISGYDNLNKVFNGRSNITGAKQQAGTYFYMIAYKDNGVLKNKSGYISLKF